MSDFRDYYQLLDVAGDATQDEIKQAFRKLARKYHPDVNPGDQAAEEKFKQAAEAYEVLSNPDKKARYDQFGHAAFEGNGGFGGGGMNMEDIFSQFGDIFGGAFGGAFGGGFGGGGRGRVKGSNLRIRVKLSLEEILNGDALQSTSVISFASILTFFFVSYTVIISNYTPESSRRR